MSNNFESFTRLPDDLQREALREGEARLLAQISIATAADQRALSWGGLLIAAATGALGGGLALISKGKPDYGLGFLAVLFAGAMLVAAWSALSTVQPGMFFLPGNNPANWLPEHWKCVGTDRKKMQRARYEQAEQISRHIAENAENAKLRAMKMTRSFEWAKRTIWISGALLFGAMVYRAMGFDAEGLLHWGGAAFHTICGN